MNKEVGEAVVVNNRITVDLDKIINEAITHIKSRTNVNIVSYNIENDKISLVLEGNKENITVLKDRLNVVEEDDKSLTNSMVNKFKVVLSNAVHETFGDNYEINLESIDKTDCIIFIYLKLKLSTIPYPITVTYKLYEDGSMGMSYMLYGDTSKDERWYASSITLEELMLKLKDIETYYNVKSTLPEA